MRRPADPTPWPLTNPTTTAGKKAAELHAEWVKQFAWLEKVEASHAKAQTALREADEALRMATTPKAQEQAEAALAKAKEEVAGPWTSRLSGPMRACDLARGEFVQHVEDHLDELVSEPELADAADLASDQVVAAVEALVSAIDGWSTARQGYADVLKLADRINTKALPDLPDSLRELATVARRVAAGGGEVVAPKPSRRHLDRRAIERGEAEVVNLDGPYGGAIKIVRH